MYKKIVSNLCYAFCVTFHFMSTEKKYVLTWKIVAFMWQNNVHTYTNQINKLIVFDI